VDNLYNYILFKNFVKGLNAHSKYAYFNIIKDSIFIKICQNWHILKYETYYCLAVKTRTIQYYKSEIIDTIPRITITTKII